MSPRAAAGRREFRDPTGVAVDPRNGDVWVVEGGGHRVQRIPQSGLVSAIVTYGGPDAGTAPGRFTEPLGIAVGAGRHGVGRRHPQRPPAAAATRRRGAWSVFPAFAHPTAVAVLTDGRLAVTELGADPCRIPRARPARDG